MVERVRTDQGSIDLYTDFDTGMITVTIREPLSVTKQSVRVSITDFLERAAMIQLDTIRVGRAQAQAFAKQVASNKT